MALSHGISQHGLGDELFDRRCRLVVAPPLTTFAGTSQQAIGIEDLRVVFKVKKSRGNKPNTAEITVYNLAESSRSIMKSKGSRIVLQAGYATTMGTVFFGDSLRIDHRHEGATWVTKIVASDGGRSHQHARVRESFTGKVDAGKAVGRLAEAMGLGGGTGLVQQLAGIKAFEHGWTAHGRAAAEMTRLLGAMGYEWSAQDGELVVTRAGEAQPDVVQLDEDHGLIGTPEHSDATKAGRPVVLKVRSLIRHGLRPGCKVRLLSRQFNGTYHLLSVDHDGDTDGGNWYSDCEAEAIG